MGVKPPQNMRIPSNGIGGMSGMSVSLPMLAQAASAVARSGHSTQENSGVSPFLAWVAR